MELVALIIAAVAGLGTFMQGIAALLPLLKKILKV